MEALSLSVAIIFCPEEAFRLCAANGRQAGALRNKRKVKNRKSRLVLTAYHFLILIFRPRVGGSIASISQISRFVRGDTFCCLL